jgi:hypothetical protein
MAIEIDDPKVEARIRELAELTGEKDWEIAVELAVREKLQRIREEESARHPGPEIPDGLRPQ